MVIVEVQTCATKTQCLPAKENGVVPIPSADGLNELFELVGSDLLAKVEGCVKSGSVAATNGKMVISE
jgi:hypothetical protein